MKYKRIFFGLLLALLGGIFSAFCFIYSVINPCIYNSIDGLIGSFLGTNTMLPFIVSTVVMIVGVVICGIEAFKKEK